MRCLVRNFIGELLEKEIDGSLDSLQKVVDGLIEFIYLPKLTEQGIAMIINEEGKLLELRPTIACMYKNEITDIISGEVLFVGIKYDSDELFDLTDEQIRFIENDFFDIKKRYFIPSPSAILDVIEL